MQQFKSKDYVTILLVITNSAVYIFCTIQGNVLYNMGSLSVVDIINRQEYYRILTSLFLHANPQHIWGNMIFLAALGDMLERSIGHGRFFAIYMLAGICKNNGTYGQISFRRMIFAIVYLFYSGTQSETTNNMAHLGGFITGFAVMAVFYCITRRRYKRIR